MTCKRCKVSEQEHATSLRITFHALPFSVFEIDQETEKITSISTGAPRGNSAAPTAARA